jgi:hypothetical protein
MNNNGKPIPRVRRSVQTSRNARLLHDLNSTLAALRLRIELVTKDSTCMWAQRSNLEAIARMMDEAQALVARLADLAPPARARRRTP